MEKRKIKYEFPFRIIDLKTNSFFIQNISNSDLEDFNADDIEFAFKPGFGFNEDLRVVKVNIEVSYQYKKNVLLKIDVDTIFEFEEAEDLDIKNKKKLAQLLGIAFSTVRGVILNRTIGNFMNNIYLPIINPTEIIEEEFKTE
ncbi:MAG: hypothetical protein AB7S69_09295 [Salinivirgaceae bacterium]